VANVFTDFGSGLTAFEAPLDARLAFIRKTYLHVAAAMALFVAASSAMYMSGVSESMARFLFANGGGTWLLIVGGMMVLSWLSRSMAHSTQGRGLQYGGLLLYTMGKTLIFAPFLWVAQRYYPGVLGPAAAITLVTFAGLSAIVLTTKKDFSFLGMFLRVGFFIALGLIVVASFWHGLDLGVWFSVAMIVMACGSILYSTSRALHTYRTDEYVGASIELFAAVMLLFWYVLRLFMSRRR
jgi:FtsH-binding integral membrane protein